MSFTPKEELNRRIANFQAKLQERGVDGALIIQNADMFYFFGTIQRGFLYIPAYGKPIFMVLKGIDRVLKESELERIIELKQVRDIPIVLQEYGYDVIQTLGLEADVLPYNSFINYEKIFSPAKAVDISSDIRNVRMIKTDFELEHIKNAAVMAQSVFKRFAEILREDVTDLELVGSLEKASRIAGHCGLNRARGFNQENTYTLLLAGPEGVLPSFVNGPLGGMGISPAYPHGPSNLIIKRNQPILLDYQAWSEGYMADVTRTFVIGSLPAKLIKAYNTAIEIHELLIEAAKPGTECSSLYELAVKKATVEGLAGHFMGMKQQVRFVGHGVGLEIDELPIIAPGIKTTLEKGMVVALEPKFLFPEGAVGIENTFVVGEHGLERLTVFDEKLVSI